MMKKITAVTAAIAFCFALTACGNSSEESENSSAEATTGSELSTIAINTSPYPEDTSSNSDEVIFTEEGVAEDAPQDKIIGNASLTGLSFTLPASFTVAISTNVDENMQPKRIPTTTDQYNVSSDSGDTLNFYVTSGIDYITFNSIDQNAMQDQLLASGYENLNITGFDRLSIGDYPVIKMTFDATVTNQTMTFTRYYIDVYDAATDYGYCYYLTLSNVQSDTTDVTELANTADTIFSSIQIDANALIEQYPNPDDLHDAQ